MSNNHVVIVHGAYGSPEEAWFPWLASKIRELGYRVSVPKLPTPEGQTLDNWLQVFNEQVKDLDSEAILVGHSIGATFILRKVATLENQIKACFLVSGFMHFLGNEKFDQINKSFVEKDVDWALIRSKCQNFFMYNSDNDPYVPLKFGEEVAQHLQIKLNVVHNGGHISTSAGYLEFPQLLDDLKKILPKHV
ncbi:MAG: serine hydrolase family protein [Anaerolineales bacterium]|nr:serine hydrolase family protein [Anaerolineales bacterium]